MTRRATSQPHEFANSSRAILNQTKDFFESLADKTVINIFSIGLISGVTMAIIQIIAEINDKVNCTPLLTTRG